MFEATSTMAESVVLTDTELHRRLEWLCKQEGSIDSETFAALEAHARAAIVAQQSAEKAWTTLTANDRIDLAFADLDESDIIALQNAG